MERKVKKERDAEGEEFKDKDAFITAGYKKRLEEMRQAEEEERLREERDGMSFCVCARATLPISLSLPSVHGDGF